MATEIDNLKDLCRKLLAVLEDAHPGLSTWHSAVSNLAGQIGREYGDGLTLNRKQWEAIQAWVADGRRVAFTRPAGGKCATCGDDSSAHIDLCQGGMHVCVVIGCKCVEFKE